MWISRSRSLRPEVQSSSFRAAGESFRLSCPTRLPSSPSSLLAFHPTLPSTEASAAAAGPSPSPRGSLPSSCRTCLPSRPSFSSLVSESSSARLLCEACSPRVSFLSASAPSRRGSPWCRSSAGFHTLAPFLLSRPRLAACAASAEHSSEASAKDSRALSACPSAEVSVPRSPPEEVILLRSIEARYGNLRKEDRLKILAQKRKEILNSSPVPWEVFRSTNLDAQLADKREEERRLEERKASRRDEAERDKPAHLRRRSYKSKRLRQEEDDQQYVTSANFSEATELLSLAEDLHKSEIYVQTTEKLAKQWPAAGGVAKGVQRDQFFDVMAAAIRDDLQDQSRPVLVNELTDLENPYSMKREALRRLLIHSCTRNCLDESLTDTLLDRRADLLRLRSKARLPPEALEPLAAFSGITRFSFDRRTRLNQKALALQHLLQRLPADLGSKPATAAQNGGDGAPADTEDIDDILSALPENFPSDELHPLHPFRNHFGFESSVPHGVVGSIAMGRGRKKIEKELALLRYPTLQRVAHSLPKDLKYRESVAHAIRVLERSRGWDFESKVKAINALVEVWNRLAPGRTYEKILNHAFPVFRARGMVKKTRSRAAVFNRGLKYIRSLTTQKPLHVRLQKKK
ncbi:hypothetical protein BESB_054140 [Besnoitia besnoiti]|uniref:DNA double-strand break repair rad50 ATPase n=1 Tax=Besnoitia besnoiti TaxID=94643 RepID=A0A2A9MJD3_BESBE|nr:hypothetical protein BESB_054140 [Besnoitia besnoiti]PFH35763.1 hypothetical protein BESB_054140 [Besnoitia besnoiti]